MAALKQSYVICRKLSRRILPKFHKADDPLVGVSPGHCDLLSAAIWAHKADHTPRHVPAGQHHLLCEFRVGWDDKEKPQSLLKDLAVFLFESGCY